MKNLMTSIVFVFAMLGGAMAAGEIIMVDDPNDCPTNTIAVEKFVVTGGTGCPSGYVTVETYDNVKHLDGEDGNNANSPTANQDTYGTYEYCAVG
jgi:hypothetical protein